MVRWPISECGVWVYQNAGRSPQRRARRMSARPQAAGARTPRDGDRAAGALQESGTGRVHRRPTQLQRPSATSDEIAVRRASTATCTSRDATRQLRTSHVGQWQCPVTAADLRECVLMNASSDRSRERCSLLDEISRFSRVPDSLTVAACARDRTKCALWAVM